MDELDALPVPKQVVLEHLAFIEHALRLKFMFKHAKMFAVGAESRESPDACRDSATRHTLLMSRWSTHALLLEAWRETYEILQADLWTASPWKWLDSLIPTHSHIVRAIA